MAAQDADAKLLATAAAQAKPARSGAGGAAAGEAAAAFPETWYDDVDAAAIRRAQEEEEDHMMALLLSQEEDHHAAVSAQAKPARSGAGGAAAGEAAAAFPETWYDGVDEAAIRRTQEEEDHMMALLLSQEEDHHAAVSAQARSGAGGAAAGEAAAAFPETGYDDVDEAAIRRAQEEEDHMLALLLSQGGGPASSVPPPPAAAAPPATPTSRSFRRRPFSLPSQLEVAQVGYAIAADVRAALAACKLDTQGVYILTTAAAATATLSTAPRYDHYVVDAVVILCAMATAISGITITASVARRTDVIRRSAVRGDDTMHHTILIAWLDTVRTMATKSEDSSTSNMDVLCVHLQEIADTTLTTHMPVPWMTDFLEALPTAALAPLLIKTAGRLFVSDEPLENTPQAPLQNTCAHLKRGLSEVTEAAVAQRCAAILDRGLFTTHLHSCEEGQQKNAVCLWQVLREWARTAQVNPTADAEPVAAADAAEPTATDFKVPLGPPAPSAYFGANDNEILRTAVCSGDVRQVQWLLSLPLAFGVDPAVQHNFPLRNACAKGNAAIAELLLELPPERGVNPAVMYNAPLHDACKRGDVAIAKLLLELPPERGVDPAVKHNSPLRDACKRGNAAIAKLLLSLPRERGVDPAVMRNSPLRDACARGDAAIAQLLLELPPERGVDPAVNENFFLRDACKRGDAAIAKLLLSLPRERGVDPAVMNNYPLCTACERGDVAIAELLLQLPPGRGVDPAVMNNYPLRAAHKGKHTAIVELLLQLPPERGVERMFGGMLGFLNAVGDGRATDVKLMLATEWGQKSVGPAAKEKAYNMATSLNHAKTAAVLLQAMDGRQRKRMLASKGGHKHQTPVTSRPATGSSRPAATRTSPLTVNEWGTEVRYAITTQNKAKLTELLLARSTAYRHDEVVGELFKTCRLTALHNPEQRALLQQLCIQGAFGRTCMSAVFLRAVESGHLATVDFLLELDNAVIDPAANDNEALCVAVRCGFHGAVSLLLALPLERGVDPSARNNEALRTAVDNGSVEIVQTLLAQPLERGVDLSACGDHAVRWAAQNGNLALVKLLVGTESRGLNPGAEDSIALQAAAQNWHMDVVEFLLALPPERGVCPDADDNCLLMWAVENNVSWLLKVLLELPVTRRVKPAFQNNLPLRTAAQHNFTDIVAMLMALPLERGVNPNAMRGSALKWARAHDNTAMLKLLTRDDTEEDCGAAAGTCHCRRCTGC